MVRLLTLTSTLTYILPYLHIGSNALRALQGLGLLETILAKLNQKPSDQHLLVYISGKGDHEQLYNVSNIIATSEISSKVNSLLNIVQEIRE